MRPFALRLTNTPFVAYVNGIVNYHGYDELGYGVIAHDDKFNILGKDSIAKIKTYKTSEAAFK